MSGRLRLGLLLVAHLICRLFAYTWFKIQYSLAASTLVARKIGRNLRIYVCWGFYYYFILLPTYLGDPDRKEPFIHVKTLFVLWIGLTVVRDQSLKEAMENIVGPLASWVILYAFHHEDATPLPQVVTKVLYFRPVFWPLYALNCVIAVGVLVSMPWTRFFIRHAAALARLDHRAWLISRIFLSGPYMILVTTIQILAEQILIKFWAKGIHEPVCFAALCSIARYSLDEKLFTLSWRSAMILVVIVFLTEFAAQIWLVVVLELTKDQLESPEPYAFSPLQEPDEIRLLLVYPWVWFSDFRCSIVHVKLSTLPIYEAVSYTWGSAELTDKIVVDGCPMKVTNNAYRAVSALSSVILPRLLWIDSISINQLDAAEKSKQVALMEKIYRQAHEVTVWLGPYGYKEKGGEGLTREFLGRFAPSFPIENEDNALESDAHLAVDILRELYFTQHSDEASKALAARRFLAQARSRYASYEWRALQRLLNHPWFSRIWVIQEVALAKEVRILYGHEEFMWQTLAQALGILFHDLKAEAVFLIHPSGDTSKSGTQPIALVNVLRMQTIRKEIFEKKDLTLPEVLEYCLYFKATDPRDLIFGIHGLPASIPDHLMRPDYAKSVQEVYTNVAETLVKERNSAHLFGYAGIGLIDRSSSDIKNLPSWVPDWTTPSKSIPLSLCYDGKSYSAGGHIPALVRLGKHNTLRLLATHLDTMTTIGPLIMPHALHGADHAAKDVVRRGMQSYLESRRLFCPHEEESYPHTTPKQTMSEVFWRTLIGDRDRKGCPAPAEHGVGLESMMRELQELPMEEDPDDSDGKPSPEEQERMSRLFQYAALEELVKGGAAARRLCRTEKGYVGICPPFTEVGDKVFVGLGVSVPLVLRKVLGDVRKQGARKKKGRKEKERPARYQFVGEAYVHGIMHGETLKDDTEIMEISIE